MEQEQQPRKCLVIVRVRGISDIYREVTETMKLLHLQRNCHATLVDNRPSYLGMLQKAQNYFAWGEISKETLMLLLNKRGRLLGDKKITDEYTQKIGKKNLEELAEALYRGEIEYNRLPNIKPVFRLHPPSKGFKRKVKRSYASRGVTGYQGEAINNLLKRMI
jgi:large subunit ribosomal protein L30